MLPKQFVVSGPLHVFPFIPTPPVIGAPLSNRLLVAARNETHNQVQLVSVDVSGEATLVRSLPFSHLEGMIRCDDQVCILGDQNQKMHSILLNQQGDILADTLLPSEPDLLLAPQIVCGSNARYHVWIDRQGRLVVLQGEDLALTPLDDITLVLTAVATPSGLTLLRTVGLPGYLQLLRWEQGQIVHTQFIENSSQSHSPLLFALGDSYILLWIARSTQAIYAQVCTSNLAPLTAAHPLLQLKSTHAFRWLRGFTGDDERLALAWQTETPGMGFSETGEPLPEIEQFVAPLDLARLALGAPTAIGYAAESFFTGGWLGDRFITLQGGTGIVAVFSLSG